MTQFVLVKTSNSCPDIKPVEGLKDDFLLGVAGKLFPNSSVNEIFVLDVDGEDIDSLMLDAQKLLIESSKFEETAVYSAIGKVAQAVDELIFWYGSDYDDLECVYDVSVLLRKIEDAVSESACELYIHYKKVM
jgi:hypothetical protein